MYYHMTILSEEAYKGFRLILVKDNRVMQSSLLRGNARWEVYNPAKQLIAVCNTKRQAKGLINQNIEEATMSTTTEVKNDKNIKSK